MLAISVPEQGFGESLRALDLDFADVGAVLLTLPLPEQILARA